jgi:hypothetical protein
MISMLSMPSLTVTGNKYCLSRALSTRDGAQYDLTVTVKNIDLARQSLEDALPNMVQRVAFVCFDAIASQKKNMSLERIALVYRSPEHLKQGEHAAVVCIAPEGQVAEDLLPQTNPAWQEYPGNATLPIRGHARDLLTWIVLSGQDRELTIEKSLEELRKRFFPTGALVTRGSSH